MATTTVPRGLVHDLQPRLAAAARAALLGVDDPELLRLIDDEVARAYRAVRPAIPVRTGTLLRALTDDTSDRRKVVRLSGGKLVVQIDHPGAYYIPAKVLPKADLTGAVSRALTAYLQLQLARPTRVANTAAGRLLSRVIGTPFGGRR